MFIDWIVKNRGAIGEPWREFRKDGNSYFIFSLLVIFGLLIFAGLLLLPLVLPAIQNGDFLRTHDVYLISALVAWILVMIFFVLGCRVSEAFTVVIRLIAAHPGEILLYCLF
jgi:hypothetical protein